MCTALARGAILALDQAEPLARAAHTSAMITEIFNICIRMWSQYGQEKLPHTGKA